MYSPDLQSKVALWRQKAAEGTMTAEDYREALSALRAGRLAAAQSAKKPKKEAVSAEDLLRELDGL